MEQGWQQKVRRQVAIYQTASYIAITHQLVLATTYMCLLKTIAAG